MSDICYIYVITNSINKKVYVGQTWKGISERFRRHKLRCNKACIRLHRALNKHGRKNFNIESLAACSDQLTADYLECFWIKEYNSIDAGYNLKEGGASGKPSKETRKRMSLAHIGKCVGYKRPDLAERNRQRAGTPMSKENRNKKSKAMLGNKNHFYGKKHSKKSNLKQSIAKSMFTRENFLVMQKMRREGLSYNSISKHFNCSRQTITNYFNKMQGI